MSKVAIIGAGSLVFTKQFLNDLFATPCMAGSSYYLMDLPCGNWKNETVCRSDY